jgi:hypothetical protein
MTVVHEQRRGFLVAVALVAGVTLYAAISAGIVEATAFGSRYGQLMAVGGIAYLAAIAFMRWRG